MAPQTVASSISTFPIHLTDGTGKRLRCCGVVPTDGAGEHEVICGSIADYCCADCGPICAACWDAMPCSRKTAKHIPVVCEVRNCNDALTALLAHRITPEYCLALLRSLGAAQWMIERVQAIEAEHAADYYRPERPVSSFWVRANVLATADMDKRSIMSDTLDKVLGERGAR
jgi:hypothetical protein